MTKEESVQLKTLIESKLVRLKVQISDLKELTQPIEPDCAIGRVSRMDAINNKSVNEAGLRKKVEQLNGLEHALTLLDSNEIEKCSVCGNTIPLGRLFVMPESRKCVRCAGFKNN
ncbi:MAG: TraR/DksA C4-type zinc finger protein [Bacteroidales bacterium]|nr:TraR/DksA C4-type zinc finger protein [Bacteroidales bacterium]